jgi:hypothetical protein
MMATSGSSLAWHTCKARGETGEKGETGEINRPTGRKKLFESHTDRDRDTDEERLSLW